MIITPSITLIMLLTATINAMSPGYKLSSNIKENEIGRKCPLQAAMIDLDLEKFYGDWYVLQYEYSRELQLRDIGCVGMHYSGSKEQGLMSNFTFRFPANSGFFYHVPTFSAVKGDNNAIWETHFKQAHLLSLVVATEYSKWAVMVQCSVESDSAPKFLSTRVLARKRSISAQDWLKIEQVIQESQAQGPFRYIIQQKMCPETDV